MTQRLLSASRLNEFLGCQHASALWLAGVTPPETVHEGLELVRRKGFEHEAVVLGSLEAVHGKAVGIPDKAPLSERIAATAEAMSAGAPLIYQGAFANDRWVGFPDFLIRKQPGKDGRWVYEPEDAKLARSAKAEHVLQLNIYARLVNEVSGSPVSGGAIHVGGDRPAERFDLRQTQHITARLMVKFESFADLPERTTKSAKTAACGQCAFSTRCNAEWREADSPVFIAGIRSDQIIKLEQAGVTTLSQIAALDPDRALGGIGAEAFGKLVRQARLQREGAVAGEGRVELLAVEPGRGFTLLPRPEVGDLFFDMEGDPLFPEGLEYLFGLWGPLSQDGSDCFVPIWAHDRAAEKAAFQQLMILFAEHFRRHPKAHIYHYAAYEVTALKKLAQRHATMEAQLDQLLREHRFVDLYTVARQAIRASTEGYSLKDLEKIYWGKRSGDVTNAGDSIVEYERWRETGDQKILDAIGAYNQDDCVSTARMRDWLEGLRPHGAEYQRRASDQVLAPEDAERAAAREAFESERQALAAAIRASTVGDERVRDLLAELLWFHQRAQKPVWWAIFDRQTWTDAELMEDIESLGGLHLVNQGDAPTGRSILATYRFEAQDTRLKEGSQPKISLTLESAGTIDELSAEDGLVVLRRGKKFGEFPEACSLSPSAPIDQRKLVSGVVSLVQRLVADPSSDRALVDLLVRRTPRLAGRVPGPVVAEGADLVDATVDAVWALDHSTLVIQGPPGTGKTYTSARAIVALLQDGKRVGVSSNSHKAVNNLLAAVEAHAAEIGFKFRGAKKATQGDSDTLFTGACIGSVFNTGDVKSEHQLVGGTAFHFASDESGRYDHLFIDEAGQVALGNLAAMAGCARNLVLVGDQMQLPQPVQGVHPGESGLSCLDYAMQDHPTVPPERGVLLNVSRRMHPAVCEFISDAIYDSRLTAHPSTSERRLIVRDAAHPALKAAGLSLVEVDHQGCLQSSEAEAVVVRDLLSELLTQQVQDGAGTRPLTIDDIVIVTPFNMQVNLLKRVLPIGARVGTVDKFQGQEALVVIVSMATSSGADAPRGTEFLFNRNRLNVAISRAMCLAILVRGAALLDVAVKDKQDLLRLDLLSFLDSAAIVTAPGNS